MNKEIKTYRVVNDFACGAVTIEGKKIIAEGTAPIFKKWTGRTLEALKKWLLKKSGEVYSERIDIEDEVDCDARAKADYFSDSGSDF